MARCVQAARRGCITRAVHTSLKGADCALGAQARGPNEPGSHRDANRSATRWNAIPDNEPTKLPPPAAFGCVRHTSSLACGQNIAGIVENVCCMGSAFALGSSPSHIYPPHQSSKRRCLAHLTACRLLPARSPWGKAQGSSSNTRPHALARGATLQSCLRHLSGTSLAAKVPAGCRLLMPWSMCLSLIHI